MIKDSPNIVVTETQWISNPKLINYQNKNKANLETMFNSKVLNIYPAVGSNTYFISLYL